MSKEQDNPKASSEALFRFLVISKILSKILGGESRANAVGAVASSRHPFFDGSLRKVSDRTLYRWLAAYRERGVGGLELGSRRRASFVSSLDPQLLDFLVTQKGKDHEASIPELLRQAGDRGLLRPGVSVHRSTVYRNLRRLGVSMARRKKAHDRDARRFAYPHRMDMVLCDGKHFRAGISRARRVALVFLDDATRLGLHAVVGTSESRALFLRGLFELITRHGLMSTLYLDHGPGFIAEDTVEVVRNLEVPLIHGEVAYPEGHGKIERLNRTLLSDLLRSLDGRPDVDPACSALELRLLHYLEQIYNHRAHESLGQDTPAQRFSRDAKPLAFPPDRPALEGHFQVHIRRRVTADNTVPIDGTDYEMPRGHAGRRVVLRRGVLDRKITFLERGRFIELHPVDLHENARTRRARRREAGEAERPAHRPKSSSHNAFDRDYRPVVDADGGFSDPEPEPAP